LQGKIIGSERRKRRNIHKNGKEKNIDNAILFLKNQEEPVAPTAKQYIYIK